MKYLKLITTIAILISLSTLSIKAQAVMFQYDAAGNMIKRVANVVCLADYTINANISNGELLNRLYTSSGKIETKNRKEVFGPVDVIVRKNEMVELRADNIELKAGFVVEKNASFKADIDPCEQ